MRTFYFLFAGVLFFISGSAQIINFPDANFKAALLLSSPNTEYCQTVSGVNIGIDVNSDGEVQVSEAIAIQRLNLNSLGISNLSGLEYFQNLVFLFCANNELTTLDVSMLGNLKSMSCNNNSLTSLNIGNLPLLTGLYCNNNLLSTLDISGAPLSDGFSCKSNLLQSIFMKNGATPQYIFVIEDNPDLAYICADEFEIAFVQTHVTAWGYNCTLNSYCSFVPGGAFYSIQGNNKYDSNLNGCDDTDNLFYPNLRFSITSGINNGTIISDNVGSYQIPVQAGNYTFSPILENPAFFTIVPEQVNISFPIQASPFTQNFCISPNGSHRDLEVVVLPIDRARPGFDVNCKIIYTNNGTSPESGNIIMNFDYDFLDFITATPTADSSSNTNLSWNYINLQPFESREITFRVNLNSPLEFPPLNAGDFLGYEVNIYPIIGDENLQNNRSELKQLVVNSFDPNDKTCLQGNTITPEMVGKDVNYMIRFENTGTANAENVVVKDMIDTAKFDINSLIPLDGSHPFVTRISNTNKVEFIFENINLPFDDANNDGYVAFKIKTKPTLVLGDSFSNTASIYFDYNFPIITDPAITTVALLGNSDFAFDNYFSIYPNPANSILNIETKKTIEVTSVNIYNTLGQVVLVIPNAQQTKSVDVSSLKTGNYFLKINSDKGTSSVKFVKL